MSLKFENLEVWKKALDLTYETHMLTRGFPRDESYILTSQMKRAADSVCLNIAEGSTGQSDKEFNRFLGIALRSAVEVVACIYIATRRDLITQKEFDRFYMLLMQIVKMIQSFRNTLTSKKIVRR